MMDTRRWGPGERIVFETYTKEVFDESFKWIRERNIFEGQDVGAVEHEVRAAHFAQHALELERPRLLDRLGHAFRAEHPLHVVGEGVALAAVAEALLDVPDGTVRDAGRQPVLLGASARGVIAAETRAADGDALRIDVGALLQPVDAAGDRHLVVVTRRQLVPAQ